MPLGRSRSLRRRSTRGRRYRPHSKPRDYPRNGLVRHVAAWLTRHIRWWRDKHVVRRYRYRCYPYNRSSCYGEEYNSVAVLLGQVTGRWPLYPKSIHRGITVCIFAVPACLVRSSGSWISLSRRFALLGRYPRSRYTFGWTFVLPCYLPLSWAGLADSTQLLWSELDSTWCYVFKC